MLKQEWISQGRLEPYLVACNQRHSAALELYLLDRRLSAEMFEDIAFVEVALRNAIARTLSNDFGENWYTNLEIGFDQRVKNNLIDAWESLPKKFTQKGTERGAKLGGRLLAACTFGTWTNMLDAGTGTGYPPPFDTANHDKVWTEPRLLAVFPGARDKAKMLDPSFQNKGLTRSWVFKQVHAVRCIRNRIAHHESLINGVPITGTEDRLSARGSYDACLTLASTLDRDLRSFLESRKTTKDALERLEKYTVE